MVSNVIGGRKVLRIQRRPSGLAPTRVGESRSAAVLIERINRSIKADRHEEARGFALAALERATQEDQVRLAPLLLKLGMFAQADDVYQQMLVRDDKDPVALRALSSLALKRQDRSEARRLAVAAADAEPLRRPRRVRAGCLPVVCAEAPDARERRLVRSRRTGLFEVKARFAHFKTSDLIDRAAWDRYVLSVCGSTESLAVALPESAVVVNTIACAEGARAALESAARLLPRLQRPIINPPAKVLQTSRRRNFERLGVLEDVHFPRTEVITLDTSPATLAERLLGRGLMLPLVVRLAGTQTGESVELLHDEGELIDYLQRQAPGVDVVASEYAECRYEDGYYGKTRVFFIDGQLYPVACLSNDVWQIHSGDRYRVMSSQASTREREQRFLDDPRGALGERAWHALHRIANVVDLDFFGIDFFAREHGVTVFEANPVMRHNFDHADAFPYTRPHLQRVGTAFTQMLHDRAESAS